jgi:streptogramin lyase
LAVVAALGAAGSAGAAGVGDLDISGASVYGNYVIGSDGNLWASIGDVARFTGASFDTVYYAPDEAATSVAAGPDGRVWFVDPSSDLVGAVAPDGASSEYYLTTSGAGLGGIAAGPDGNLWFTETAVDRIGRVTPSGTITEFSLPSGFHVGSGIVAGPDGNVWFTGADLVGRIALDDDTISVFPTGTSGAAAGPIAAGPDGNVWAALGPDLGKIAPDGTITTIPLGTYVDGLVIGSDGNFWVTVDGGGDKVGRITPWGGQHWWSLNGPGGTTAISVGPDDYLWFTSQFFGAARVFAGRPAAALSAASADFGTLTVDDTAQRTITLHNTGTGDLAITHIALTGADAADVSLDAASTCAEQTLVGPDATCDVVLDVAPTTGGTKNATLRISAPVGAPADVPLTAEVRNPVPTGSTGAATAVTAEAGSLSGLATPNGGDTHAYFEYGETTGYGSQTASQDLGDGTDPVAVTASLSGLRPSTTYHFRLVATSTSGTTYGADATLTTGDAPATTDVPPPDDHRATEAPAAAAAPAPLSAPVLTARPGAISATRTGQITFTSPAGATQCRLDGGPWIACTSPYAASGLIAGAHVLAVRTVDASGRPVGDAAEARFEINPNAPTVTLRTAGTLRPSRSGIVTLRLLCSPREGGGRGACSGTATLRLAAGSTRLGHATFRANAGRTATVRIKLSHKILLRLPHGKAVRAVVTVDVKDLAGNRARASHGRTLRRG